MRNAIQLDFAGGAARAVGWAGRIAVGGGAFLAASVVLLEYRTIRAASRRPSNFKLAALARADALAAAPVENGPQDARIVVECTAGGDGSRDALDIAVL